MGFLQQDGRSGGPAGVTVHGVDPANPAGPRNTERGGHGQPGHPNPANSWLSRPLTLLLLLWMPLVKWLLPPGLSRFALFYGGGGALSALAVLREQDWARLRPLFAHPWRGLLDGMGAFAALMVTAAVLILFPPLQPWLPLWVLDALSLLDPLPAYIAFQSHRLEAPPQALLLTGIGAIAEEWVFRAVLLWRWAHPATPSSPALSTPSPPGAMRPWHGIPQLWRVLAVSLYFALMHWPGHPMQLVIAFSGSLVLGVVLLWSRNFTLVAVLHVLFNWKTLVFV